MKKIVVILIVGLYIGSIFLVNFFGLQYVAHELTIYVDGIECNTITDLSGKEIAYYKIVPDEETQKDVKYFKNAFIPGNYTADEESLANNPNTYTINCSVLPDNANNKALRFSYTEKPTKYIINEENRTITFLKRTSVRISIISTDGSNISEMIFIGLN